MFIRILSILAHPCTVDGQVHFQTSKTVSMQIFGVEHSVCITLTKFQWEMVRAVNDFNILGQC